MNVLCHKRYSFTDVHNGEIKDLVRAITYILSSGSIPLSPAERKRYDQLCDSLNEVYKI